MLKLADVNRIAEQAASATLGSVEVSRILTDFATDSDGKDALSVTIVFRTGNGADITGDSALNAMVRILHDLERAGEARFPIIHFATEEELASHDDPES